MSPRRQKSCLQSGKKSFIMPEKGVADFSLRVKRNLKVAATQEVPKRGYYESNGYVCGNRDKAASVDL